MADRRRSVLVVLKLGLCAVFAVGAVRTALFTVYRVAGTSMLDTLVDGDRIVVCDVPWLLGEVDAGDTVVLAVEGEVLVKRVVALPGDRIALQAGRLFRNGRPVREDIPPAYRMRDTLPETPLGADEYFVLGDNRRASVDSREFGPVGRAQLLGTVVLRMARDGLSTVAALNHP